MMKSEFPGVGRSPGLMKKGQEGKKPTRKIGKRQSVNTAKVRGPSKTEALMLIWPQIAVQASLDLQGWEGCD